MTASTSTSPRTSSANLTPQRQLKILLLGSSGAGKTALALRYAQNCFNPHQKSTIGVDFFTKQVTVPDGSTVSINIWDTAGQERFHSLVESFFRGADACILVMDPTQPPRETLASLTYWHAKVMHHLGPVASASHFPFLVVATKSDLDASVATRPRQAVVCERAGSRSGGAHVGSHGRGRQRCVCACGAAGCGLSSGHGGVGERGGREGKEPAEKEQAWVVAGERVWVGAGPRGAGSWGGRR
ncbi:P-loop containing nucleoside triphosphate hydrolase protein [Catenaria anguillulae PL171]|uniref:p-loop containing nucleoside triphosphate hydrolase protein n=1 Tax=Catenaria anguillulae PL171 TaxID=765915 RepID=A0A1Y2H4L5_9FUNG|nr:P-loop containing nucleoside triphosphate hydrolase protein [Catenaria anguillulae PL171]